MLRVRGDDDDFLQEFDEYGKVWLVNLGRHTLICTHQLDTNKLQEARSTPSPAPAARKH